MLKALPDSTDRTGIGFNRLGLQSLELQVFQMRLVVALEYGFSR